MKERGALLSCIRARCQLNTMNPSSITLRFVHVAVGFALCVFPVSLCWAEQEPPTGSGVKVPSSVPELVEAENPGCPSPVLPEQALFLGQYANLELTITAKRDGSLEKVVISKKSKARLYDEYTRNWVEKHWKMPPAKGDDPNLRSFIAPIVYPEKKPPGGHYPAPNYPLEFLRDHVQGLVVVEINVAPSGEIESTRTVMSSGNKKLDAHSEKWVLKKWKFPPGDARSCYWPVAYIIRR